MDIICKHMLDRQRFQLRVCFPVGGIFQLPIGREHASAYLYIVARRDRKERLERDMLQGQISFDARVWLGKEIRMTLHPNPSRPKDVCRQG